MAFGEGEREYLLFASRALERSGIEMICITQGKTLSSGFAACLFVKPFLFGKDSPHLYSHSPEIIAVIIPGL